MDILPYWYCCRLQALQPGRDIDCFSSLPTYIKLFNTRRRVNSLCKGERGKTEKNRSKLKRERETTKIKREEGETDNTKDI